MSEKMNSDVKVQQDSGVMVVDLKRLWEAICKKWWLIVLMTVLFGAMAFFGTKLFITPNYQSSALFYVNNTSVSIGDTALDISTGDISASKSLVDTYIVILKSRESLNDVIDYAGVNRTYGQLTGMISAASVNDTEIFEVVVTSEDPAEAEKIANAIAEILPKRIAGIVEGSSAKVVDHAVLPSVPSSPNVSTNTMIGMLAGLVLMVVIIALIEFFDVTIKTQEDVIQCCNYPILAAVPKMETEQKTNHGKKYRGKHVAEREKSSVLLDDDMNFIATEAYKLLRTKLQFSFTDEKNSHVIMVSSALEGEGKSVTSMNLAASLGQLDRKVILVECDLRRPTVSAKIKVQQSTGLANYLTGQSSLEEVTQTVTSKKGDVSFQVITAGSIPPNPIELLSSKKMENLVQLLRESYDYILLDLPPVGEVSDPLVTAKLVDGVLLVSRQNYCNRLAFADAIRQFEFTGTRILGVLINCAAEETGVYGNKYYRYGKYRRYGYYRRYHRGYGYYKRSSYYGRYAKPQDESGKITESQGK